MLTAPSTLRTPVRCATVSGAHVVQPLGHTRQRQRRCVGVLLQVRGTYVPLTVLRAPYALQVRSGSAAMLARTRARRTARDAPENADGQSRRLSPSRATKWRLVSAPSGDLDHTGADAQVTHGTDAQQEAVKKRCVESNCRHGEVWQVVAKHPDNARCSPEVILRKVSAAAELDVRVPICPSACAICA